MAVSLLFLSLMAPLGGCPIIRSEGEAGRIGSSLLFLLYVAVSREAPTIPHGFHPGLAMRYPAAMISLNDRQADIVALAARALPPEKREAFVSRIERLLKQRSGRPSDAEVAQVVQLALATLVVSAA